MASAAAQVLKSRDCHHKVANFILHSAGKIRTGNVNERADLHAPGSGFAWKPKACSSDVAIRGLIEIEHEKKTMQRIIKLQPGTDMTLSVTR